MWKFQHPGGQAEINDLHVPTGKPILINMISQDVIHSLYIPALRIQMETLPGRYTQLWFKADRPGVYHILCSEFCGTDHSLMAGLLYDHDAGRLRGLAGQGAHDRRRWPRRAEAVTPPMAAAAAMSPAPDARTAPLAGRAVPTRRCSWRTAAP